MQLEHPKFMHRLHNLLFLPPLSDNASIRQGWKLLDEFSVRFSYDDSYLSSSSSTCETALASDIFWEKMRNMCNNTLLPVPDCCSCGMQKSEKSFKETEKAELVAAILMFFQRLLEDC